MSIYNQRASKNLRKMIIGSGLSVEKIAFGSGVSKATIHNYLLKKRQPSIAVLEKIAKFLNKEFTDFFRS